MKRCNQASLTRARIRAHIYAQWPSMRLILTTGLLFVWFAVAQPAIAATSTTGIGNPTTPLAIDPGPVSGAVETADVNFYTGANVFHITDMPDTEGSTRSRSAPSHVRPLAQAAACACESMRRPLPCSRVYSSLRPPCLSRCQHHQRA